MSPKAQHVQWLCSSNIQLHCVAILVNQIFMMFMLCFHNFTKFCRSGCLADKSQIAAETPSEHFINYSAFIIEKLLLGQPQIQRASREKLMYSIIILLNIILNAFRNMLLYQQTKSYCTDFFIKTDALKNQLH